MWWLACDSMEPKWDRLSWWQQRTSPGRSLDEAAMMAVDVAVDHNIGVVADVGGDAWLGAGAVVAVELEVLDGTGGEAVGTGMVGHAVGETVGSAMVGGAVGEAVGTARCRLEVREPVGVAVVADRVEVAVGPGPEGADVGQVAGVVVGAELGLRLGAEVLGDTAGEAVGSMRLGMQSARPRVRRWQEALSARPSGPRSSGSRWASRLGPNARSCR